MHWEELALIFLLECIVLGSEHGMAYLCGITPTGVGIRHMDRVAWPGSVTKYRLIACQCNMVKNS